MSTETKKRSGMWYLLPIFLSIIGGVIAYFVIKEDDPKKAKNCLYLGIILTAIGIGFTAVSGIMFAYEMENSPFFNGDFKNSDDFNYATPSEMSFSDESQINSLAEGVEYEYNVFGLKPNYIHVLDEDGNIATKFDNTMQYAIVSEIQNRDDSDKNISYNVFLRQEEGDFEDWFEYEVYEEIRISPNGTFVIDEDEITIPKPGIYEIEIWLEDIDTRNAIYDEIQRDSNGDYPQPFWRMLYLE
ncbi:hypothetical protein [Nitrosopumilus sp.]|uniref:hypothetical protein n=1 Tax=Nitrosopumilus sp. TaxID=2024843 RepID=UPI003B5B7945